ncbi:MAG: FKBP-type peptidyl-prolyl cis-trans isomerase [Lachnospiraceae bacterium]|nr:FKBP-type peptidyl-prolyl cis-trans isomerase [Lachnospiraceae bacterium]
MEENNTVSKSKQKREERAKSVAKQKRENLIFKIVGGVIALAVVGLVIFGITRVIIKEANTITASGDYSAQLDDNGYIKGVRALDYVTLCNYKGIEVPKGEVTYTDEEFQDVINQALSAHQVLKEEGTVKDGDKVNIDYVGTMDGVEFEGGNSGGNGYDLTIGSGQFIEGFESQLIGHKAGEEVTVNVTFPENYNAAELAGKPAQFAVTIHGIYVNPELNDDFVCAYYPDMGSTVAEYEQSLRDGYYEGQLKAYVDNYLTEKSTVNKFPSKYLKNLKATTKYSDVQSYQYMSDMYAQYGQAMGSFEDFIGMSDTEYDADITDRAEKFAKADLVYQAVLESEGITLTEAESEGIVQEMYGDEEFYNSSLETYGKGYTMKNAVKNKAVDIAIDAAVVK